VPLKGAELFESPIVSISAVPEKVLVVGFKTVPF
jgi:hypothetical protein